MDPVNILLQQIKLQAPMITDPDYAYLLLNLSDSLRQTGALQDALAYITQAAGIYRDLENYMFMNCEERLSTLNNQLGNSTGDVFFLIGMQVVIFSCRG